MPCLIQVKNEKLFSIVVIVDLFPGGCAVLVEKRYILINIIYGKLKRIKVMTGKRKQKLFVFLRMNLH